MAQEFTDVVKDYKLKVEKEGSRKFNHQDHILIKEVDKAEDQLEQGKKQEKILPD